MKTTLSLIAVAILAGCASKSAQQLVTTEISYTTNGIVVHSPKDVIIDSWTFEDPKLGVKSVLKGYSSTASAAALKAAMASEAGQMAQWAMFQQMIQQFGAMAASKYGVQVPTQPTTVVTNSPVVP